MKRYYVKNAKCDITEGGIACGPVDGSVVVTVEFSDGNSTQYLSLVEVQGIPNVFLCEKDVHEEIVKEDFDDEEFNNYLQEHFIEEFDGIDLSDEYYGAFRCFKEDPENPAVPLIRYLITLVRCSLDDEEELITMAKDKYVDELDIPVSDLEEEYFDEDEDA